VLNRLKKIVWTKQVTTESFKAQNVQLRAIAEVELLFFATIWLLNESMMFDQLDDMPTQYSYDKNRYINVVITNTGNLS
jgi:hypothetical protein